MTRTRPQVAASGGAGHLAATALRLPALLVVALTACEAREDDAERFRERCEQFFACDCVNYGFPDLDACMQAEAVQRAGWLAEFEAVGLTPDIACMDRAQGPDPEMCLTQQEYEVLHPFDFSTEETVCGAAQLDEFCDAGAANCGPDLVCDYDAGVCREFAGPGESCFDNKCAEGLWCHQYLKFCLEPVGLDEECDAVDCQAGLACMIVDTVQRCRPIPEEGEHCDDVCVGELRCEYSTHTCMRWGQPGDPCDDAALCAEGLACADGVCEVGPAEGEPCDRVCALGLECQDAVCEPEKPQICVR